MLISPRGITSFKFVIFRSRFIGLNDTRLKILIYFQKFRSFENVHTYIIINLVCHLEANLRTKSAYLSATRQDRLCGFPLKDVLLSAL